MTFIKLTHTGGFVYLNLENVYSMEKTSATDLTVTDFNSGSVTYTFASASDLSEAIAKLESITRVIDIDSLAKQ